MQQHIRITHVTTHVTQIAVPTPTLPPSYETNTYVVTNQSEALIIDCGSADAVILQELSAALVQLGVNQVAGIVATHYHRDHTGGMGQFADLQRAPIFVHALDAKQAAQAMGKPLDAIQRLPKTFNLAGLTVAVEHHAGHTHGHLHLLIPADSVILVGDHMAGDSSVWIGPPDGHMAAYYQALDAITNSGCRVAGPGHGAMIADAPAASSALLARRQAREAEIIAAVTASPRTVEQLLQCIYGDTVVPAAQWVARKTIQAHLQHALAAKLVRVSFDAVTQQFLYSCGAHQ